MKGRKRHILTDTDGRLVAAQVHTADIQDRDGAPPLLTSVRTLLPWLRHVFADGGYACDKLRGAMAEQGQWKIDIIKRSDTAKGFVLLPRRWVIERTLAHLNRCRRLAKDFEACIASEVRGINVAGHADLEILLTGFNRAYNRRRQRVLRGGSPSQKAAERIQRKPALANPAYKPAAQDDLMAKVDGVLYYANDVSQPDS